MKNTTNQDGFTLIEVMIAIFILTIGIIGAASMQVVSIEGNSTAMGLSESATWGGDRLERLMALPYGDAMLSDANNAGANAGIAGLDNTDVAGNLADAGPVLQGNFTLFWNVADDYPILGTKTIRVLVRRSDQGTIKTISQDFTKMRPI